MKFGLGVPWIGLVQQEMRQKRAGQALEAAETRAHKNEDLRADRERHATDRATQGRRYGHVLGWIGHLLGRLGR